jgi:hypothetical protein
LDVTQHIDKADRNKDFLNKYLLAFLGQYQDWVSVVGFYSALHYVEALLAEHGIHRIHHQERNTDVSTLMEEIENEYLNLYDLGRNSRYGSLTDIPSVDDVASAVKIDLPRIEEYIKSRL